MSFAKDPTAVRGAIAPLITPFTEDGAIDPETIASLVDFQLAGGSHGISVGGSTGEPTSMSIAERLEVMEAAVQAIDGRVPFLPGTGSARMDETLELTAAAERLGAAAALVVTPYYGRAQQQGLFEWYSRIAAELPDMPILIYNVPIRAAVDITPDTVARLRRVHENIVGIKETTKDFEHVSYVLDACGSDFIALSGIELLCYPMLALGGRGHLSCVSNFAPQPVAELYDAFVAGDQDRARALHYDLHPLVDAAFAETNPVPAKWIMRRLGLLPSDFSREPLAPLSEDGQRRVGALLERSEHVRLTVSGEPDMITSTSDKRRALMNGAFHTPAPGRLIEWGIQPGSKSKVYVLAEAATTGRRCTVAIHEIAAGEEGRLHAHTLEDEGFYVLEGDILFLMPDDEVEIPAAAGEFVWQPMGRTHGFRAGDKPVRLLQFLLPGTELVPGLFEKTEGGKGPDPTSPEELAAFARMVEREYGLRFSGPEGPPPTVQPRSQRGPVTPDARLLTPPESEVIVNRPFKSGGTVHKIRQVSAKPADIIFHAFGHQTGNVFGMLELLWHAPTVVGPHSHTLEDEYFYVVEGEFTLHLSTLEGPVTMVGGPGDLIWGPRDVPHYFTIRESARVISGAIPGGTMIDFFYAMANAPSGDQVTDEERADYRARAVKASGMHFMTEDDWPVALVTVD